jgi:HlyD family secretion protein
MIKKILKLAIEHKIIAAVVITLAIFGAYFGYAKIFKNKGAVRYAIAQVQKGELIVSVSGSGKLSASNQIDIKPKISGEIVYVGVKEGEKVKSGTLLFQFDSREAEKAVRDAEVNLENAKLSLEKLKLAQRKQLRGDVLNKAYEEGMKILADFYGKFSTILNSIDNIFFGNDLSDKENNISYYANYFISFSQQKSTIPDKAKILFSELKKSYEEARNDFQIAERGGSDNNRSQAIRKGYEVALKTAQLIKLGRDAIRPLQDYFTAGSLKHEKQEIINSHENVLSNYDSTLDTYIQNLLTILNTINSQEDLIENQPFDLLSQELILKQKENALLDAKEKLEDYFVRAPFDGVIAKVDVKKGDFLSLNNILATLISYEKIAEISLNEIDVAKLKIGQEAILTFDAFPELEIRGKVIEISTLGTEEQGVVSYDVKISLEKENTEIKPGMTVNAKIFVDKKENVLLVPNSAIKSDRRGQYVEIVKNYNLEKKEFLTPLEIPQDLIEKRYIETGTSNDEFTEVLEGLKEGEVIIVRTLSQQTFKNPQQTNPFLPRLPFGQQRRQ